MLGYGTESNVAQLAPGNSRNRSCQMRGSHRGGMTRHQNRVAVKKRIAQPLDDEEEYDGNSPIMYPLDGQQEGEGIDV